jgi:hypothetical protein
VYKLPSALFVVGRRIKYSLHDIYELEGAVAEAERQNSRNVPYSPALILILCKKYSYIKKFP